MLEKYDQNKFNQENNNQEKWEHFSATGKVMDYLDYRACVDGDLAQARWKREDTENGADHSVERYRSVSNAHKGL